jgi:hypothetical protein
MTLQRQEVTSAGLKQERSYWRGVVRDGAMQGERNVVTSRLIGHLLRHHIDPAVALHLVLAWNQIHNKPPLPADEVIRTVDSIAGLELRRRGGPYIMDDWGLSPNMAGLAALDERPAQRESQTPTQILMQITRDLSLFPGSNGRGYASGLYGGQRETWPILGRPFRKWLTRAYRRREGKPPASHALNDVIQMLDADAAHGAPRTVYTRVASRGEALYLNLIDEARRIVAVTPKSWGIATDAPIYFLRSTTSQSLPIPVQGDSLEEFRTLVNIPDEASWRLLVGWLLGALQPSGPYPILVLQGEQGSAKSTVARILKYLIDPSSAPIRSVPRDEHDLLIAANHSYVLAFDNLSGIPAWLSDALCRLSTGGGFATRELYSDSDEVIFEAKRPVILNGIDDFATRQDLIDRSIVITLPAIHESARRPERHIWNQVEALRPSVLGSLLTGAQHALANRDLLQLPLRPRMADFALWVSAAESAWSWAPGTFLQAYQGNRSEAMELGLESTLIAPHLRNLLEAEGRWTGTAGELLEVLRAKVSEGEQRSRMMPQTPQAISNQRARLAPSLRAVGIHITKGHRESGSGRRLMVIEKSPQQVVTVVTPVTATSPGFLSPDTTDLDNHDNCDNRDNSMQGEKRGGFPTEILGMGTLRRNGESRCKECPELTCFSYGGVHLCCRHARLRAEGAP